MMWVYGYTEGKRHGRVGESVVGHFVQDAE